MSAIENTEPEIEDPNAWMEEEHDGVTPWHIRNSVDAAEAMRRARFFQAQIDDLAAVKLAQIDQVDRWYAKEVAKVTPKLDKYRIPLERFSDEKEASLSYPAGKLNRRKGSEVVEVEDEDAFVAWAMDNDFDKLVRMPDPKPMAAKDEIKKAVQKDGPLVLGASGELIDYDTAEVVPGIWIKRNEPSHKLVFAEVDA